MKIIIIAEEKSVFGKYKKIFQKKIEQSLKCKVEYLFPAGKSSGTLISDINAKAPDILISVDLLGFEQGTLTGNISYNLLNCKQIHLILQDKTENEKYLSKVLSIAMFFYCAGDAHFQYLSQTYPHLPYLKRLEHWDSAITPQGAEADAQILCSVLEEVCKECCLFY